MIALVRYDAACRAIAAAKRVDEAKKIRDVAVAMRAYAKQAKNKAIEADAWEIRMRAERRVGELIALQRETVGLSDGGRPAKTGSDSDPVSQRLPTLQEAGIDKHLADRARKHMKADGDVFERQLQEGRARILDAAERIRVDLAASTAHVGNNGGEHEWYTPAEFIEAARSVIVEIDLDPASSKAANEVVKAKRIYTAADDGLSKPWRGRVWLNPPYAQPLVSQFADKLAESVKARTVSTAIVLVNNATETAWFRTIADVSTAICFPQGRVRFWSPGKESAAPLQGQALLYVGSRFAQFERAFAPLGEVWRR